MFRGSNSVKIQGPLTIYGTLWDHHPCQVAGWHRHAQRPPSSPLRSGSWAGPVESVLVIPWSIDVTRKLLRLKTPNRVYGILENLFTISYIIICHTHISKIVYNISYYIIYRIYIMYCDVLSFMVTSCPTSSMTACEGLAARALLSSPIQAAQPKSQTSAQIFWPRPIPRGRRNDVTRHIASSPATSSEWQNEKTSPNLLKWY